MKKWPTELAIAVSAALAVVVAVFHMAPPAAAWETVTPMPASRYSFAAAVVGGKIYVLGGTRGGTSDSSVVEVYDPVANAWTTKAPMPTGRTRPAAAAVAGKIYVIGGKQGGTYLTTVEEYDPGTNAWSTRAPMPTAREGAAAVTVGGDIYVIGGTSGSLSGTVERYSPSTNTWSTRSDVLGSLYTLQGAVAIGSKIYAVYNDTTRTTVKEYDPVADQWREKGRYENVSQEASAVTSLSDRIYLLGGLAVDFTTVTIGSVMEYDPGADSWAWRGSLTTARSNDAAATVDSTIYAIGGLGSTGAALASVEAQSDFSPPTGSVTINNGALCTNIITVTLTLSATDPSGVSQMRFSNDGSSYSQWEAYDTSKSWQLPQQYIWVPGTGYVGRPQDGSNTVFGKYNDSLGNVSSAYTGTILLDVTPPTSTVSSLPAYTNTLSLPVSWSGGNATCGVASYDVQYKDGPSGNWTDLLTSTTTSTLAFTGTEGHTYYFQSRARDRAGNVEEYPGGNGDAYTTPDLTAPAGSLDINAGAIDTSAVSVTLVLSASDSLSAVSGMSFSNDGVLFGSWEGFATAKLWYLSPGDGLKTVYVRFRDSATNQSITYSDTVNLDTSVSAANGLGINDGALFTNKVTVTLALHASPWTSEMMVSNDGSFTGVKWEPYAAYKSWQITQYGSYVIPRTVYVRYKDLAGNVSSDYQDDIILDVNAPNGSVSLQSGGASIAEEAAASPVTLRLSASDDVSGVGGMMVSNSAAFTGASWEPFAASKSWNMETGGKVYVTFRDNAGNASPTYTADLSGSQGTTPSVVLGTVHPKTGGLIISSETNTNVAFPPGAVGSNAEVTLVPAIESTQEANTGALKGIGKFLTLTATMGGNSITAMSRPYTMTVGYTPADVAGIDESTLGMYWWNGSSWQKEPTSAVDTTARTVTAAIDHLSAFGVLGEGSGGKVYLPLLVRNASGW